MIEFLPPVDCPIQRVVREMEVKPFGEEHRNFTGLREFSDAECTQEEGCLLYTSRCV